MRTYINLSKEQQVLNEIQKSTAFKLLLDSLPDFDIEFDKLRVSFNYEPTKTQYWYRDGVNYTREIESNNISNSETRSNMEKKYLVKDVDSKGDAILYPED